MKKRLPPTLKLRRARIAFKAGRESHKLKAQSSKGKNRIQKSVERREKKRRYKGQKGGAYINQELIRQPTLT